MPKPGQKQIEKKQQTITVNEEKTEGGVYKPVFPTVEAVLVTKGAPDITKEDVEELVIAG